MVHRQMIAELLGQILYFDHKRALSISLGRADASRRNSGRIPAGCTQTGLRQRKTDNGVAGVHLRQAGNRLPSKSWRKIILDPRMSSPFSWNRRYGESGAPAGGSLRPGKIGPHRRFSARNPSPVNGLF
jgi:hypothetical protein